MAIQTARVHQGHQLCDHDQACCPTLLLLVPKLAATPLTAAQANTSQKQCLNLPCCRADQKGTAEGEILSPGLAHVSSPFKRLTSRLVGCFFLRGIFLNVCKKTQSSSQKEQRSTGSSSNSSPCFSLHRLLSALGALLVHPWAHLPHRCLLLGLLSILFLLPVLFCLGPPYRQHLAWTMPRGAAWPYLQLRYLGPPPT